jgi:transposase
LAQRRLATDADYPAIQQIPGIGPILAAVFIAEIGDVARFAGPAQLTCWAGLTPRHHVRHHRAPRADHQTGLAAGPVLRRSNR